MSTLSETNIREAIHAAADLAETAPEKYQEVAFRELLRLELGMAKRESFGGRQEGNEEEVGSEPSGEDREREFQAWELELFENLPEAATVAKGSRSEQAVWAVIRLLDQGEPATVSAIRDKIRTELGVSPQSSSNTSRTLTKLEPDHLSAVEAEEGGGNVYQPTRDALQVFDNS